MTTHSSILVWEIPGSSVGKESTYNAGGLGSISGLGKSSGGGQGNLLQYSCLENPYGQRSLACCSPWSLKELDMISNKAHTHSLSETIGQSD